MDGGYGVGRVDAAVQGAAVLGTSELVAARSAEGAGVLRTELRNVSECSKVRRGDGVHLVIADRRRVERPLPKVGRIIMIITYSKH